VSDARPALEVRGLRAGVAGREVLRGVDLEVGAGEVHAVMGPNGAGKSTLSHVLMGRPGYEVLGGSVLVAGEEVGRLPTWQRARRGLFLAPQVPTEVPGVPLRAVLAEALAARGGAAPSTDALLAAAGAVGLGSAFLDRAVNVDLSGGERKRSEVLQLAVVRPRVAVLDEIDSGLDVDGLRAVARQVVSEVRERGLAVLAITHYPRLLSELVPDRVHVLLGGRVVRSGGPELAEELERTGYAGLAAALGVEGGGAEEPGTPL
jgi:Fe-S cluster assembly ATP-binding protein